MKHSTPGSIKFLRLKRRLGLPHFQVVGILESLWHLTATNAPNGDLSRFNSEDIAIYLEFPGDPAGLILALVETGWLDQNDAGALSIHDWLEHAPNWVKGMLASQAQKGPRQNPRKVENARDLEIVEGVTTNPNTSDTGKDCPVLSPPLSPVLSPPLSPVLPIPIPTPKPKPTQTKDTCAEPLFAEPHPHPDAETVVLTYPTRGKSKFWNLTVSRLVGIQEDFPGVDCLAECRAARAWAEANPTKRKTASGMPTFLVSWITRTANRQSNTPPNQFAVGKFNPGSTNGGLIESLANLEEIR